ncbi:MAG: DUF3089 domain-containing protein [Chitinophagaceae bacterium]|nr:DUF3089 domain-containing protein [Chitinophagaceae bacterium]
MKKYKRKISFKNLTECFLCFVIILYIFSCSPKKVAGKNSFLLTSNHAAPDYSNLNNWAAHPFKKDPSDRIPAPLQNQATDSVADVFFIYPTTYTDANMKMGWNADVNDDALNKKTDNSTILYQASVFNNHCRIFAPRYRQANLKAFYTSRKDSAEYAFNMAYEDVRNAFEYYLKHYNNGRPIIIASHSQGTLHAGRLLKEFFEEKPLQKKLVCAYIIGLPVFKTYFKALQPCRDSTSTGCFITWRTFEEGYIAPFIEKEQESAYVVNPLTWTMSTDLAADNLNKGGILKNFNKVVPGIVHAQIHGNILWVNKPRFFGSVFLTMKNYHIADYNLFYVNIRENAGTRILSWQRHTYE